MRYRQVLQEGLEQEAQPLEELFKRLDPPPMPKAERSLRTSRAPQKAQTTSFSPPRRTRASKRFPQPGQQNS